MILSVGPGTDHTYVVKNKPNWIPLIDVEDLIDPQTLVNIVNKLNMLEYNVILSNNSELQKLLKNNNIKFITVVKYDKDTPVKVNIGKSFILNHDKFLKDFLEEL